MTHTLFSWEVELPERNKRSLGQKVPCAKLSISSPSHGTENLTIPLAVGRRIQKLQEEELCNPRSRAELLYLLKEQSSLCAWNRLLSLINKREYSSFELKSKLKLDAYRSDVIDACIERAIASSLVSDERFANAFIRSKIASSWGRRRIAQELKHRGIEVETLPSWPHEYFSDVDEFEQACRLLSKKRITGTNDVERFVRFLIGKGYTYELSFRAAREVLSDNS